jgi:hypothetical protein
LAADDASDRRATSVASVAKSTAAVARLIPVSLPITGNADANLKRMIDQALESTAKQAGSRPILIFEFRAPGSEGGDTSEFERSLSVARYLASDRLSGVRTIAYLPRSDHWPSIEQ